MKQQSKFISNDCGLLLAGNPTREPFITIDDLTQTANELTIGLRKLCKRKHPLVIRRGVRKREGVREMADQNECSKMVKAGSKTYFFDIKKAENKKPYLVITESRFKGENKDRERRTIIVFPESASKFSQAVSKMTEKIA